MGRLKERSCVLTANVQFKLSPDWKEHGQRAVREAPVHVINDVSWGRPYFHYVSGLQVSASTNINHLHLTVSRSIDRNANKWDCELRLYL
jgi:hypothetical protein